jgi:hypothetical protein
LPIALTKQFWVKLKKSQRKPVQAGSNAQNHFTVLAYFHEEGGLSSPELSAKRTRGISTFHVDFSRTKSNGSVGKKSKEKFFLF